MPGWFVDTLARIHFQNSVRVVYIDCDLKQRNEGGTSRGNAFSGKGRSPISQDYHIDEVRALLDNNMVCEELHQEIPKIVERYRNLAVFRYN